MSQSTRQDFLGKRRAVSYAEAKRRGLNRYFTGKPCSRGHLSDRSARNRACLRCDYDRVTANKLEKRRRDPTFRAAATLKKKEWEQRRKREIIAAYGGKCECCGESNPIFLSIDHMNGGGRKHREEVGGGKAFYSWIIQMQFPPGFRILCFNCNFAVHHLGVCPHKERQ